MTNQDAALLVLADGTVFRGRSIGALLQVLLKADRSRLRQQDDLNDFRIAPYPQRRPPKTDPA